MRILPAEFNQKGISRGRRAVGERGPDLDMRALWSAHRCAKAAQDARYGPGVCEVEKMVSGELAGDADGPRNVRRTRRSPDFDDAKDSAPELPALPVLSEEGIPRGLRPGSRRVIAAVELFVNLDDEPVTS